MSNEETNHGTAADAKHPVDVLVRRDARIAARQVQDAWMPYPENKPFDGWCATTDGGDINLIFWRGDDWAEEDRGIIEFMQVTVNA